jgi:flagellar biosynthesis protein FliO
VNVADGVATWQVVATFLYVGVLAGLGLAIVHFARRGAPWRQAPAAPGTLRVVASTRVSPTLTVSLLDVQGRQVLIAATASGTSMIELAKSEAAPPHE